MGRAIYEALPAAHRWSFGAIGNVDVEFGPGPNVLYGPNDLGKSALGKAIRLGLPFPSHVNTL